MGYGDDIYPKGRVNGGLKGDVLGQLDNGQRSLLLDERISRLKEFDKRHIYEPSMR